MSRRAPAWLCASCGYMTDATTAMTAEHDRQPKEGDFALCINCGHVSVFNAEGTTRPAADGDLANLSAQQRHDIERLGQMFRQHGADLTKGDARA